MSPVEIVPVQSNLVLRARGSELLIIEHHVVQLKKLEKPREFSTYFIGEALVNRPARKLFEAWLRKDRSLWQRIFKTIHKDMEIDVAKFEESQKEEKQAIDEKAPGVKAKVDEAPEDTNKDKPEAEAAPVKSAEKDEGKPKTTPKKSPAAKKTKTTAQKAKPKSAVKKAKTTPKKSKTTAKKTTTKPKTVAKKKTVSKSAKKTKTK